MPLTEDKRKTVGIIIANLERGTLGLRSRQADDLAGKPVLRRTVERFSRVKGLDEVIVFAPIAQAGKVSNILAGLAVEVVGLRDEFGISPAVRWRKWSLHSWRGGIGEAMYFDEQMFSKEIVEHLQGRDAYSIVWVAAEAVLLDIELTGGMVGHHKKCVEELRFTFSAAAPGLVGCAYRIDMLYDMVAGNTTAGASLAYRPDMPQADFLGSDGVFNVEAAVRQSQMRYIADTQRCFSLLEKVIDNGGEQLDTAAAVEQMEKLLSETEDWPREIELEINTAASLRVEGSPFAEMTEKRPAITKERFEHIVGQMGQKCDDICLTIAGMGEPLAHESIIEFAKIAHQRGIYGVNIESDGLRLDGRMAENLIAAGVDVVTVWLDADDERAIENARNFVDLAGFTGPRLVAGLTKTIGSMGRMEEFYDYWLRKSGGALLIGFNDYCGQVRDRAVMNMCPPQRYVCRKLISQLTILCDGSVVRCGQDYKGSCVVGNVFEQSIDELWKCSELERLRGEQLAGRFSEQGHCTNCKEWHR